MSMKRGLKGAAIAVLALLALVGITLAQQDLFVTSIASKDTIKPGEQVIYSIGVKNSGDTSVYDVTVTDKLPPEVAYVSTNAEKVIAAPQGGALPTNTLEVAFDVIPAGETKSFDITVTAPTAEEPVILYNYVLVRARNIDQDIFKETKTIVMPDYDRFHSVRSIQDLLINQSRLLLSFEDLLHMVSQNNTEHISFLQSFEQLLKTQAVLISGFQNMLYSTDQSGWTNSFTNEQKIEFLMCYEEMLKKEAILFGSFQDILKKNWCSMGDTNAKKEFSASFEDLLHKQVTLYSSFEALQQRLGLNDSNEYTYGGVTKTGTAWDVQFLDSFETLLRLQSDLLLSFQDLMNAPCNLPEIEVKKTAIWSKCDDCNQWVIYTITVANKGSSTTTGVNITDYLPVGTQFSTKYNPGWRDNGDGTVSYRYGDIPGNTTSQPVSLTLFVPPALGLGPFVSNVCVDSDENGKACSSASISRTRVCSGIVLNKTAQWSECNNNSQNAIYTIIIANTGSCNVTGVRLIDTYPSGAGFSAEKNPGWMDNMNGTLTYVHADIPIGNNSTSVTLVLNFPNSVGLGPFNNTVCAYTNEFPPVCGSANISRDQLCPVSPEIVVNKTAQWGKCDNGSQDAIYTITVANKGSSNVTGVNLVDTYPSGAGFSAEENPSWVDSNNSTLTYSNLDIPVNTTAVVPLVLNFPNSMGLGPFVNSVCAYISDLPEVCSSISISRDNVCPVTPMIVVNKTAQWGECNNGTQDAIYTITVANKGSSNVTGVNLLDTYPSGAGFSADKSPGWTDNNGTLTYSNLDIPKNATAVVSLVLNFPNSMGLGPFVNSVCAYVSNLPEVCSSVSISRDNVCPVTPMIEVNKTAKWGECNNGSQDAIYTIAVTNEGSSNVTGVKLIDTYPDGAGFLADKNPGWTDSKNGTLTYRDFDIPANNNTNITLVLNISNGMGLGPFNNTVCAYIDEYPRAISSVSISRDELCPLPPDIVVTKTAQWDPGLCNAYVKYNITVDNLGDKDAKGVRLIDYPPEGADFNATQNPGWINNSDGTLTYDHPDVQAHTTAIPVPLTLFMNNSLGLGPFKNNVCVITHLCRDIECSNEYTKACTSVNISRSNTGCVDN